MGMRGEFHSEALIEQPTRVDILAPQNEQVQRSAAGQAAEKTQPLRLGGIVVTNGFCHGTPCGLVNFVTK